MGQSIRVAFLSLSITMIAAISNAASVFDNTTSIFNKAAAKIKKLNRGAPVLGMNERMFYKDCQKLIKTEFKDSSRVKFPPYSKGMVIFADEENIILSFDLETPANSGAMKKSTYKCEIYLKDKGSVTAYKIK